MPSGRKQKHIENQCVLLPGPDISVMRMILHFAASACIRCAADFPSYFFSSGTAASGGLHRTAKGNPACARAPVWRAPADPHGTILAG